jgi:hypothetical protein
MVRRLPHLVGGIVLALALATGVAAATAGADVRVSTHDLITSDAFVSSVGGPPDVLQQNEPHIAIHPTNSSLLAVGMNDVRTLGISNDAWQGLAVSSDGGATYTESLIPGYPGDTSAAGLASPIRGNAAASDPWLGFDRFNNLFFAFIAFQRTPPGQPTSTAANALAVAKYSVNPTTGAVRGSEEAAPALFHRPSRRSPNPTYEPLAKAAKGRTERPAPPRATTGCASQPRVAWPIRPDWLTPV